MSLNYCLGECINGANWLFEWVSFGLYKFYLNYFSLYSSFLEASRKILKSRGLENFSLIVVNLTSLGVVNNAMGILFSLLYYC